MVFLDNFKSEGSLILKIKKSQLRHEEFINNYQILSQPEYIRGLPWKILVTPRLDKDKNQFTFGYFLQCNSDMVDVTWHCRASANLKILSQKEEIKDHVRVINHTFYNKENDWGYRNYLSFDVGIYKICCKNLVVVI